MAIGALVIYLFWAGLAFGLRTWVQWRRTGDTGFRGGGLAKGSTQWWARVLFTAALLIGAAGPIAALAGLPAVGLLDHPAVQVAGAVLAVAGLAGTLAAQASMGSSWRIGVQEDERTELVTAGAFALARNPIFTTMAVTAAGLAGMVPNAVTLFGLALTIVAVQMQVRAVEEPYLLRAHGDAYAAYAARVGRFLPGIGRLAPDTRR
ncbi:methyltransferase family protein [Actinomadura madurae]|uniref:methyltransferase family protein n=1 Tax=Actinomadura madurae TaxID=1993 RepID=UPI002025EE61|nr:isoprenylcysteine carboxylmethyltransferase family protein [Actinomadura madurae]MCP9949590.1 isoprenylcysteine carboxylmethyltransferase family protein [Actinomadura madurae]MCP9966345.1 isoprenylcysteine carboxylmethyltransferase family protein [Actinomadura madurae]MCP9978835.1 isoprenylcysteine carboxylmethyltransferase family protein [Actinomadura madurae]MCQ0009637.1 isoprenylcysteine carboxylmethyltransferase family protein [Actinomadura madurae]MCQ0015023.1 isoprenylcysteine carboxy